MTIWLKQSTATILKMGPFVDTGDAVTPETGLSIVQADIRISANGGAFSQTSDGSPATTHDAGGWYPIPLTATDTAALGTLKVHVTKSGALPVWQECMVVPGNVWDSLFGADRLQVDTREFGDGALDITAAMAASVGGEVGDALGSDTIALPGSGAPTATPTIEQAIGFLYKAWRNKTEQTASEYRLFADDGSTVDQEADVSDDATTFSRSEMRTPS